MDRENIDTAANALAAMYDTGFGGKSSGRYRIPRKLLSELLGRRRIYGKDIRLLSRVLFERGYVLIDMDSFFVVLSTNSFVNYRRANQDAISAQHIGLPGHEVN